MSDIEIRKSPGTGTVGSLGSSLLTLAGLASAFGVAACCALPLLMTSVGIGAAWLSGVALAAAPFRTQLLALSALALVGGAVLVWRQQWAATACGSGECMPRSLRILNFVGLLLGAGLLWAGYTYA